ncbi:MAG TPA: hypothetical protein PLR10_00790 [Smithella sp.]|nr:hypothetical protein [Smithella sp.]HQG65762.1 hypothetical protein [Smithella sp.]HQI71515.1 hypothetical protein [Smithella sp.]
MTRNLIILANSRKMGNRCIAGIDAESGEWIRPCFENGDSGVPWHIRQVNGVEPQLLDIIKIPLADDGPHRDIQPENRTILAGAWQKVGEKSIQDALKYCQQTNLILFNTDRKVHVNILRTVPSRDKRSLFLIRTHVSFSTESAYRGKRVNARFIHEANAYCIPVTDYEYERRFPAYGTAEAECLLTISLGIPYEIDNYCYKFVAGVIELCPF